MVSSDGFLNGFIIFPWYIYACDWNQNSIFHSKVRSKELLTYHIFMLIPLMVGGQKYESLFEINKQFSTLKSLASNFTSTISYPPACYITECLTTAARSRMCSRMSVHEGYVRAGSAS